MTPRQQGFSVRTKSYIRESSKRDFEDPCRDWLWRCACTIAKLTGRRFASEILRQLSRGVARDKATKPEGMQLMIDLVREDSKVSQPFTVAQIVDYSFLGKARLDLGVPR